MLAQYVAWGFFCGMFFDMVAWMYRFAPLTLAMCLGR